MVMGGTWLPLCLEATVSLCRHMLWCGLVMISLGRGRITAELASCRMGNKVSNAWHSNGIDDGNDFNIQPSPPSDGAWRHLHK